MEILKEISKLEDLDISGEQIQELILKMIYTHGPLKGKELSNFLKVPFSIIEDLLVDLKKRDFLGVIGASIVATGYHSMDFDLAPKGRERAREIMKARSYVGPVPVTMKEYLPIMETNQINTRKINAEEIEQIFLDMTLSQDYITKVGPAINSGGPILFFGEPGNGKTMIAEKVINAFSDHIYVPHCLLIDGQYIKYFDEKVHIPVTFETSDPRWVKVKRPFIVVGGELTLPMLDLIYKDDFKYYEAPPQLRANGGVLLIDDFGRQIISPKELLNRWIYPLEKKVDYLTLVTGKKIEVPFNQLLIFSSNLNPADLGDDAFLRRIKYKIEIISPNQDEFRQIFMNQCKSKGLTYSEDAFNYLVKNYYHKESRDFRSCHPRDLLAHIVDFNSYYSKPPLLTKENIKFACQSYFSKFKKVA